MSNPWQWRYLNRAIRQARRSVDFLLTAKRDLDAAKRFFPQNAEGSAFVGDP